MAKIAWRTSSHRPQQVKVKVPSICPWHILASFKNTKSTLDFIPCTCLHIIYLWFTYFRCTILQSGADFSSTSGRAQLRRPETGEKHHMEIDPAQWLSTNRSWICWHEADSFQLGQWACHGKKCFPALVDVHRNFNLSRISLPVVGECTAQLKTIRALQLRRNLEQSAATISLLDLWCLLHFA